ncbi:hypothetical protein ACTFIY_007680 [Dictyostelium cf. discoideum]
MNNIIKNNNLFKKTIFLNNLIIKRFYCYDNNNNNNEIKKVYFIKDENNNTDLKKMIKIGDIDEFTKKITLNDVKLFSEICGDANPIHIDESYSKKTRYGKCIVHGALVASLIPSVVSKSMPGCIYIREEVNFTKPTFVNDIVKAETKIIDITGKKITFSTQCTVISNDNDNINNVVIKGTSIIHHPNLISKRIDKITNINNEKE